MYSRIQDFISLDEPSEYEYKYEKAVDPMAEVVIMEPCSFEEIPQVIQSLQKGKSVLLNVKSMDPEQAQRAVDFVAGGIYAIKGHQERVAKSLFLFTPIYVQVTIQASVIHPSTTTSSASISSSDSYCHLDTGI